MKLETDEDGDKHYYYYDAIGNLKSETVQKDKNDDSTQYTTQYEYNYYVYKLSLVRDGHITSYGYDYLGRLIKVTDAKGQETYYSYDNLNNLTSIYKEYYVRPGETFSKGISKYYDDAGRLIKEADECSRYEYYKYDAAGNLTQKIEKPRDRSAGTIGFLMGCPFYLF